MTIKSQETCRENFSHKCFKFNLFIQIQGNELHVLRSQQSITLTVEKYFSIQCGVRHDSKEIFPVGEADNCSLPVWMAGVCLFTMQ